MNDFLLVLSPTSNCKFLFQYLVYFNMNLLKLLLLSCAIVSSTSMLSSELSTWFNAQYSEELFEMTKLVQQCSSADSAHLQSLMKFSAAHFKTPVSRLTMLKMKNQASKSSTKPDALLYLLLALLGTSRNIMGHHGNRTRDLSLWMH